MATPAIMPRPVDEEPAVASRRARELYKYFIPPGIDDYNNQANEPDPVLQSHVQLAAWRLDCSRAMISLIDRENQYFVAEASKTLHLHDTKVSDVPVDKLWAGCVAVPKAGRLCEHTLQQSPLAENEPAYFEVCDLSRDDRFRHLAFVAEEPHFRYYCGVPLLTKGGTAIGSLYVLDDRVREPCTRNERMFLGSLAQNAINHYENSRAREDRKRVQHMNMCLAAFVDPENQRGKRKRRSRRTASSSSKWFSAPGEGQVDGPEKVSPGSQQRNAVPLEDSDSGSEGTESTVDQKRVDEDDNIETFKRAADLLHAALALERGGGVVFMDTATSYRSRNQPWTASDDSDSMADSDLLFKRRGSQATGTLGSTNSWEPQRMTDPPEFGPITNKEADVLAMTKTQSPGFSEFTPLVHEQLTKLIKRHPRGKFYNFDPEGISSSSSEGEDSIYNVPHSKKSKPSSSDLKLLQTHFPGARQIIFLPMWDATSSRFSTLFAYTTSDYRTFTQNPDFTFAIAFSNCVMTEVTRLATMAADQQKADFLGSVSHELRSPLHGILASCEFLADTETTSFQRSFIDTADSCARTLLDTINMVLDYSKINAFERNDARTRKRKGVVDTSIQATMQQQLQIFGNVDLAAVTEEVVEGVATGQIFKDSLTGVDAMDLSVDVSRHAFTGSKSVELILDIAPRADVKDWIFFTQPGAFRRIIMNICGNALKYTKQGCIVVKLEAHNVQRPPPENGGVQEPPVTHAKLTITDTGQGMSPQFMRTKLYTPFAQENPIAPGTGLGLSLVKSMVTMLNGEINIVSAQGVGTQVTISFPMTVGSSSSTETATAGSGSTPTSAGSIERVKDESLSIVQRNAKGRRAVIYPEATRNTTKARVHAREAISKYLTGWFGFELVDKLDTDAWPDLIVTEEASLAKLKEMLPNGLSKAEKPMVIVLCSTLNRAEYGNMADVPRLEAVAYPFGPFKLARSVRLCLEKLDRSLVKETEAEIQATAAAENNTPKASTGRTSGSASEELSSAVEQLTIQSTDPDKPDVKVIKSGVITANEESVHAGLVLDSSGESGSSGGQVENKEFPFPAEVKDDGTVSPSNLEQPVQTGDKDNRPTLASRKTISPTREEIVAQHAQPATPMSKQGALTSAVADFQTSSSRTPTVSSPTGRRTPRLLLVDDNKVNLRLLQTFMKKRKYADVYSAEDGLQAVNTYKVLLSQDPPHPPDIIFMDISMPVMNGFQATREIRDVEAGWRNKWGNDALHRPGSALIIALTGLASGRDQSEAFTSGFDLFLTKPTSFREVGRLLDNWEKSGEAATVGAQVPHGAVTGEDIAPSPKLPPVEGEE